MNIYVGNLAHETTEAELREAFQAYGEVEKVTIIKDRYSGESRGFGFVEMPSKEEAQSAMKELNGTELKGRALTVNEARPRVERGGNSGGGGGRERRPGGTGRPSSGGRNTGGRSSGGKSSGGGHRSW
ncbi:RNA-binding protein [bacterium]|nr:RNA-binding protein [bacterium]